VTKRVASGALQVDADICNALDQPTRGCYAGEGPHVDIPADWATRIAAGQFVPGCSYHAVDASGLTVSDAALAKLAIPAEVNKLRALLKDAVPAFSVKLASATQTQLSARI
jgi:hypothetical protein